MENYLKICNGAKLKKYIKIKKKNFPKVSIISPVYNREQYLSRFLRSIQNQKFKDIEIIFIDDCSLDNSTKIINEYQKDDDRILLIKNKKNKGTFKSRNIGVIKSKGQYIIIPDPDDILSKDSLYFCYNYIKKYNYEMIRFNIYRGYKKIFFDNIVNKLESRTIYQPELSTYLFYGNGNISQIDFNVANKFIKREAYIRALNTLSNYYLNLYMINYEDGVLNYILYRTVKSFFFLKKIAYYYIKNKQSITTTKFNNNTLKFIFIHLKVVFEYSKNTKYEKDMVNAIFHRICIKMKIKYRIRYLKNEYKFYIDIINMLLDNEFISIKNKKYLKEMKYIIEKNKINKYKKIIKL